MGKIVAIIPARGNSKRLPRKNILQLNGRPLITYAIDAAIKSCLFDEVVVSTEDLEIRKIAERHGAKTIVRPQKLSKDNVGVSDVCTHILLQGQYAQVKSFCCIYPTAVFITSKVLNDSYSLLESKEVDVVMGVSEFNHYPVQALIEKDNYLAYMWPDWQNKRSQEYPKLCVSNGTFYWCNAKSFRKKPSFYPTKLLGFNCHAIDIDTQDDFNHLVATFDKDQNKGT